MNPDQIPYFVRPDLGTKHFQRLKETELADKSKNMSGFVNVYYHMTSRLGVK